MFTHPGAGVAVTRGADNQYRFQYIFSPTPTCRDRQVSSIVEFKYSIIMHTVTMSAHWQMQA